MSISKQFGIGTVFLTILICALLLGWWRTSVQLKRAEAQIDEILRSRSEFANTVTVPRPAPVQQPKNTFDTAEQFVSAVISTEDQYTFEFAVLRPVINTPLADAAVPRLVRLLQDPERQVRERALYTLGQLKRHADATVPEIIPLLQDEHPNVRWHAANSLHDLGTDDPAAIAALKDQMNDDESPIAVYSAIVLERLDDNIDTEPRVIDLLFNGTPENRERAVEWVLRIKREALDDLVRAHRVETDPKIRRTMARVIAIITHTGNGKAVTEATVN